MQHKGRIAAIVAGSVVVAGGAVGAGVAYADAPSGSPSAPSSPSASTPPSAHPSGAGNGCRQHQGKQHHGNGHPGKGNQGKGNQGKGNQGKGHQGQRPGTQPSGSPQPSGAPSTPAQHKQKGQHGTNGHCGGARTLLQRAQHAEIAVGVKHERIIDLQRGTVTAISPTSVTVKSRDGFSGTYVVNAQTKVRTGKDSTSISAVKTSAAVRVLADQTGSTKTAVRLVLPKQH